MDFKALVASAAIALTFAAFFPYIRGIWQGTIRPHVFSWVIWGVTTLVVFLAQWQDRGGAGAWAIGVSACITLFIGALAFLKRADAKITWLDRVFFVSALASLPLWYFTADPKWAVVILTTVDLLGFGPTVRKVRDDPHAESLGFFGIFLLRNLLVIVALENYSVTTVLFPAAVAAACGLVMAMIVIRRKSAPRR